MKSTTVRPSWFKTFCLKFESDISMSCLELSTVIASNVRSGVGDFTTLGETVCENRRDGMPNLSASLVTIKMANKQRAVKREASPDF